VQINLIRTKSLRKCKSSKLDKAKDNWKAHRRMMINAMSCLDKWTGWRRRKNNCFLMAKCKINKLSHRMIKRSRKEGNIKRKRKPKSSTMRSPSKFLMCPRDLMLTTEKSLMSIDINDFLRMVLLHYLIFISLS
jgi:hypothetical protein